MAYIFRAILVVGIIKQEPFVAMCQIDFQIINPPEAV